MKISGDEDVEEEIRNQTMRTIRFAAFINNTT